MLRFSTWNKRETGASACSRSRRLDIPNRSGDDLGINRISTASLGIMNYTIEPASEPHFVGLHRAIDMVAREKKYLAFTQAPPLEQSLAFYRGLQNSGAPHFVALEGAEVVGWVDVAPHLGESRAHMGTLGIALVPSARHQGLGARLMQAAIDKSWSNGLSRIELCVRADNINAKALYERFGFELEGTLRRGNLIDGQYYDVHVMSLLR